MKTVFRRPLAGHLTLLLLIASCMVMTEFVVLAGTTFASDPANSSGPSAEEVFKKSREAYASLSSYSDKGTCSQNWPIETFSISFDMKMCRPNFYRVSWNANSNLGLAWNAGKGCFLAERFDKADDSSTIEKKAEAKQIDDLPLNFVESCLPGLFFNIYGSENPIEKPSPDEKRLPDEKVGSTDCYVFVGASSGGKNRTIWIGKNDFLIRQIKIVKPNDVETANALNADQEKMKKDVKFPELLHEHFKPKDTFMIETHTDIIVNQQYVPSDFSP